MGRDLCLRQTTSLPPHPRGRRHAQMRAEAVILSRIEPTKPVGQSPS